MNAPWSPEQREWLKALGHDVFARASPVAAPGDPVTTAESADTDDEPATPLLRALQRAAGGADRRAVLELVTHLDALRISPAAKRALWPRLRALRKARR